MATKRAAEPVALSHLHAEDFPVITSYINDRQRERFVEVIDELNAAVAAKQIANPVYKELREFVSRRVYDTYKLNLKKHIPEGKGVDGMCPGDVKLWYDTMVMGIQSCRSTLKKAMAIKEPGPYTMAVREYMNQIMPLVDVVDGIKQYIVKKVTLSDAQKEARDRFVPPPASRAAQFAVYEALNKITEDHAVELVRRFHKGLLNKANEFFNGDENIRKRLLKDARYSRALSTALKIEMRPAPIKCEWRDGYNDKLKAIAERDAHEVRERFVHKNLAKLAAIVDYKEGFDKVVEIGSTVDMSGLEGRLRVMFKDGASFTVQNMVVWSTSVYGTPFLRFPLTFHDVVLADGTKMKSPSEQRMLTVFAPGMRRDPAQLAADAADRFNPTEEGYIHADAAKWEQMDEYPLARLGSIDELASRFLEACAKADEEGRPDAYADMLGKPIEEPVVILQKRGKPFVWDGERRIGAAAHNGQTTIKAVVGTPLEELVQAKTASRAAPAPEM